MAESLERFFTLKKRQLRGIWSKQRPDVKIYSLIGLHLLAWSEYLALACEQVSLAAIHFPYTFPLWPLEALTNLPFKTGIFERVRKYMATSASFEKLSVFKGKHNSCPKEGKSQLISCICLSFIIHWCWKTCPFAHSPFSQKGTCRSRAVQWLIWNIKVPKSSDVESIEGWVRVGLWPVASESFLDWALGWRQASMQMKAVCEEAE